MRLFAVGLSLLGCAMLLVGCSRGQTASAPDARPTRELDLQACRPPGMPGSPAVEVLCGTYQAYENRLTRTGRKLSLDVVVIPALSPDPKPDPIFLLAGGPGQAATMFVHGLANSPLREDRDIVLIDQRGTNGTHQLSCDLAGSEADPQGYLEDMFQPEVFQKCKAELQDRADLRFYTTPLAVDDFDEIREALGYDKINLIGISYGSRAALVYLRRHPSQVRSAILNSVATFELKNPLYHARSAQDALDRILDQCDADPSCRTAFPNVREELATVLTRLAEAPAKVQITHPVTQQPLTLTLSARAFGEAMRVFMYSSPNARKLPLLIHQAAQGNLQPFTETALMSSMGIRGGLAFGMLMSVVCSEDVPRTTPDEIRKETQNTFLGDVRVRTQIAACEGWPTGWLPANYAEPVHSTIPVLIISGALDPVTPVWSGETAARTLPNSLHIILPGSHSEGGPCVQQIEKTFLNAGTVAGIDTSCVGRMQLPPFSVPSEEPS